MFTGSLSADLLLGDVWLCAGQSNMAFAMAQEKHATQVLPQAHNPLLRLYNPAPGAYRYNSPYTAADAAHLRPAQYYLPARWQAADSASVRAFSAVGYYAGQVVQQFPAVAVGVDAGVQHAARRIVAALQHGSAGSVSEQNAAAAIGVVGDAAERLGSDHQNVFVPARFDERGSRFHPIQKPAAGGGDV